MPLRKWLLTLLSLLAQAAAASEPSARDAARQLLEHLAAGNLEAAAQLSTAPKQRYEVLRQYRDSVGDAEFRRVFSEYPAAPAVEVARGERRLLIWRLPQGIAGQYYLRVEDRFLLDDVPSKDRARLRSVLNDYRSGKLKLSD